jgi:antirestriction protein ArdC
MQKTSERLNLYQVVTDRIVANLEKGIFRGRSRGSPQSLPAQQETVSSSDKSELESTAPYAK